MLVVNWFRSLSEIDFMQMSYDKYQVFQQTICTISFQNFVNINNCMRKINLFLVVFNSFWSNMQNYIAQVNYILALHLNYTRLSKSFCKTGVLEISRRNSGICLRSIIIHKIFEVN